MSTSPLEHSEQELKPEHPIPLPQNDPPLSQPTSDLRTTSDVPLAKSVIEGSETKIVAVTDGLQSGLTQQPDATSFSSDPPSTAVQAMNLDGLSNEEVKARQSVEPAAIVESMVSGKAQDAHGSQPPYQDEPMPDAPHDAPVVPSADVQPSIESSEVPVVMEGLELQSTAEVPDARSLPKVSHPRDDDDLEAEPATKRARAEDSTSAAPEFKVPEQPTTQNAITESSATVGSSQTTQTNMAAVASSPAPDGSGSQDTKGLLSPPAERDQNPAYDSPMTKAQQKHLQRAITNAKKSQHASAFNQPVDPVALNLPTYFDVIKEPMDLKTIDTKLKNDEYSTVGEYLKDFDRMVSNTLQFNGSDHPVTQHAFHLRIGIDRNLITLPAREFVEPTAAEKKAKKAAVPRPTQRRESRSSLGTAKSPTSATQQTFALGPSGIPTIRRDSTVADGRPRREIHPPAPKDLPYSASKPKRKKFQSELKFCSDVLKELNKPKYSGSAWPFYLPVDPVALNIPTYHKVIKKPMDLSTVDKKLTAGQYENAKEFEQDIRLMFNNCYKFNPAEHPVHDAGKQFEKVFDEQWATKSKWLREHAPSSGAQSPGSSPDPEDEEEEDDEEEIEEEEDTNANQIAELQRSIEAMAKQVATLQQKKITPPASNKKKKARKTAKKDTKKAAPKHVKKAKMEKVQPISYEEKMSLSDRISDLAEPQMQMVINIIRNAMPRLGVSCLFFLLVAVSFENH